MKVRRHALVGIACALAVGVLGGQAASQTGADLFFSEYVEGSSNHKALEISNQRSDAVDLAAEGYAVQMFFNGNPAAGLTIGLTGTVAPGDVYVLAHASADPAVLAAADQTNGAGWFNGDDAVALVKAGAIVDVIGQIGLDPGSEWGSGLTSTQDNTLRRKSTVVAGDPVGSDAFDPSLEWDGFATNTFDGLGAHFVGEGETPPSVTVRTPAPGATDVPVDANVSVTFSEEVDVADGWYSIVCGASGPHPATVSGGPTTFTLDPDADFAQGEACDVTIVASQVTDRDGPADPMVADATWSFTTFAPPPVIPIGEVQGSVGPMDDGPTHTSPLVGDTVVVRAVVYQKTLGRTSSGNSNNGIFLQNTAATADGDPTSSDGIFVFMGGFTDILRLDGGPAYVPAVGDEIVLRGRVTEFFNLTQLSSARLVEVVSSLNDLDTVLPAVQADPPDDLADAGRYWERHEGERMSVPAGSLALNGRDVFGSTADSEIWVMRGDHPLAGRVDPYVRRAFRDPHPLDNNPAPLFDDGNGYRIMLGSLGVKAAAGDNTVLLDPARTFAELGNDLVGGLYFSFEKYGIQTAEQPEWTLGADPAGNAPPEPFHRKVAYSVANYNVENLYDFRDDPHDGCDFAGNPGCPGVDPPFDYVPAGEEVYQEHLRALADQIAADLHAPDVLLIQEAEDQDICTVAAGALSCGAADDADGKPDTLQELALAVQAAGGPAYDAAYDRDGADDRGIVSAFMYRTDRVALLPADAGDPVLGDDPRVDYRGAPLASNADVQNPKSLNADLPDDVDTSTGVDGSNVFTRAPQVGHFRVWRTAVGKSMFTDLYAVSNHFSSGPDGRVGQRTEQAAYNAAIVEALGSPRMVVGGDLNVFPRPDDPFAPGDALFPSDQLAPLYDEGLTNLWDVLAEEVPASAYTYVFQGQAQTLDHQFVTSVLEDDLRTARVAHVNADFPAEHAGDGSRGASDHDPLVAVYESRRTIEALADLVRHYADEGAIAEPKERILLDRLERAADARDRGRRLLEIVHLSVFALQVHAFSPRHVDRDAARALVEETKAVLLAG